MDVKATLLKGFDRWKILLFSRKIPGNASP
jgi:hypothetical protein